MIIYIILILIIIFIFFLIYKTYFKTKHVQKKYIYSNLIISKALKNLGKEKKKIGNIINKTIYRPGSITIKIKKYISYLLNNIIMELNNLLDKHYIIHDLDVIIIEIDKNKNKKILVDFFIINTTTNVTKRLITEIIIKENKPHVNFIRLSNAKYINSINKISPRDVHNIGINTVIKKENMNDLNHLNDLKNKYIGLNLSSLESTDINYHLKNNSCQNVSKIRNNWIKPTQIKSIKYKNNIFPNRKIYNKWDNKGIQSIDKISLLNEGINSSETNRNIVAKFNPTIHTLPRDNLGLAGYFDLSLGIPSFPTSTIRPN